MTTDTPNAVATTPAQRAYGVLDWIRNHENHLDMATWLDVRSNACQTRGCFAGWTVALDQDVSLSQGLQFGAPEQLQRGPVDYVITPDGREIGLANYACELYDIGDADDDDPAYHVLFLHPYDVGSLAAAIAEVFGERPDGVPDYDIEIPTGSDPTAPVPAVETRP